MHSGVDQPMLCKERRKVKAKNLERMGLNSLKHWKDNWSSYKGLTVDTLAHRGDEGRGYLR